MARFAENYLPPRRGQTVGGFRFLTETGANYVNCHYMHVPTATGPGHSVILTGSVPALNGIAGNDWYDRTIPDPAKRKVYCVYDPAVETVGGTSRPMSPRNLKVTTVGDELKMATNGRAKVVGIAFKDRAAILMAGHAADTVIWYEDRVKGWVTSTHYAPTKNLPAWVGKLNGEKLPVALEEETWTPSLPESAYRMTRRAPFVRNVPESPIFSHPVKGIFTASPQGQGYVFETVQRALDAEGLGKDDVPDILAINLSTNDYIGHAYGPNSPEVMDISVRTDRLLSELFNALNKKVSGGLARTIIVVTADHGVVPIVEEVRDVYKMSSVRRGMSGEVQARVDEALSKRYGPGKWAVAFEEPNLYLDRNLLASRGAILSEAQDLAAEAARSVEGVHYAFSATKVLEGRLPAWPWTKKIANGFHPKLSGDVLVFESPGSYWSEGTGTGHGSPWAYDTHVPMLVRGSGIRPGMHADTVSVSDLAPTLCVLLGIEQPSGCVGKPLSGALGR